MTQTILAQPIVVTPVVEAMPTTNGKANHHLPMPFSPLPAIGKNGRHDDDGIDWEAIIDTTEEPVDPLITEPHYSLLIDPLYDSWSHPTWGKQFMVAANNGIFSSPDIPGIAPDVYFSLGVVRKADMSHKRDRSYYIWVLGKVPEVVVEIVSNTVGKEDTKKKTRYEELGILYYIIYDPELWLQKKKRKAQRTKQSLYLYKLNDEGRYVEYHDSWLPEIGLGVTRWVGVQKGMRREFLRWCDEQGVPIPTGAETAEKQRLRAEQEHLRAEEEHQRAEQERLHAQEALARSERLAARLRALGLSDEDLV